MLYLNGQYNNKPVNIVNWLVNHRSGKSCRFPDLERDSDDWLPGLMKTDHWERGRRLDCRHTQHLTQKYSWFGYTMGQFKKIHTAARLKVPRTMVRLGGFGRSISTMPYCENYSNNGSARLLVQFLMGQNIDPSRRLQCTNLYKAKFRQPKQYALVTGTSEADGIFADTIANNSLFSETVCLGR